MQQEKKLMGLNETGPHVFPELRDQKVLEEYIQDIPEYLKTQFNPRKLRQVSSIRKSDHEKVEKKYFVLNVSACLNVQRNCIEGVCQISHVTQRSTENQGNTTNCCVKHSDFNIHLISVASLSSPLEHRTISNFSSQLLKFSMWEEAMEKE
ncbi:hypothetical protein VP01_725g5 [Puccinia sorghi]|uniref:Uncharacterized protein n=1 Tax=Puccinia sorghi TaxID=27349 RepID=A0A0L6UF97_9BASI|nr:hypothetical protein VP01_725g5 [Puccinia sorghi]